MRKLTVLLAALAFGVLGLACGGESAVDTGAFAEVEQAATCNCLEIWDPVCGEDGVTYGNECRAACEGVKVVHDGFCNCICPDVIIPVCGEDGVTYDNKCQATCAGVEVKHDGPCSHGSTPHGAGLQGEATDACICPEIWDPVCGEDGVTYGNECRAACEGVKVVHDGYCHCICPEVILPVCGEDGVTYGNKCLAACAGVEVKHDGPCSLVDTPK